MQVSQPEYRVIEVIRLRKDLRPPLPPFAIPAGIALESFDAGRHARAAHLLLASGYAPGDGAVAAFDDWLASLLADSEFDARAFIVARDDSGALVGLIHCWIVPFVKDLVVAPAWRRRGLGEALLRQAFLFFRDRGEAHLDLKVVRNNASGAERLYRRLGMVAVV